MCVYSDGLFVFIHTLHVANYKQEEKLLNYEFIFLNHSMTEGDLFYPIKRATHCTLYISVQETLQFIKLLKIALLKALWFLKFKNKAFQEALQSKFLYKPCASPKSLIFKRKIQIVPCLFSHQMQRCLTILNSSWNQSMCCAKKNRTSKSGKNLHFHTIGSACTGRWCNGLVRDILGSCVANQFTGSLGTLLLILNCLLILLNLSCANLKEFF